MFECVDAGMANAIGVSNFNVSLLHELLCGTDHVPAVVQSEASATRTASTQTSSSFAG